MALNAGILRHRIRIEQPVRGARDEHGGEAVLWAHVCDVWASIEPASASERTAGPVVEQQTTHLVRMRWRRGIASTMRVRYEGRIFQIASVVNVGERREELQLVCAEVAS